MSFTMVQIDEDRNNDRSYITLHVYILWKMEDEANE